MELGWLALLLDPRYRQIAVPEGTTPTVAHKVVNALLPARLVPCTRASHAS